MIQVSARYRPRPSACRSGVAAGVTL